MDVKRFGVMADGHKEYIGDGVYVAIDRGMVLLTTEDGIRATNSVYMEPEVLIAFMQWLMRLGIVTNG